MRSLMPGPSRIGAAPEALGLAQHDVNPSVSLQRPRRPGACERCRERKTKCDAQRPRCGYCVRRSVPCVYTDEIPEYIVGGSEILAAIGNLTRLVEQQNDRLNHLGSPQSNSSTAMPGDSPIIKVPKRSCDEQPGAVAEAPSPSHASGTTVQQVGAETVLEWDILASYRSTPCLFAGGDARECEDVSPPALRYREMLLLEARYIRGVHIKNPFLDLSELRQTILYVAENGPDWSTRTCLVALVCAIGAATQCVGETPSSEGQSVSEEVDIRLSKQFWGIATKRLGLAIGNNTVEAVQCLCLAGIWHMHHLQAVEAWRFFHLAGAAWHSVQLVKQRFPQTFDLHIPRSKCFTGMQALHFTIWKSECELLMELPLPSTSLDDVLFPHGFPDPPTSRVDGEATFDDDERTWWYYLSEIAARHLLNRISYTIHDVPEFPTSHNIQKMLRRAEMMETQIHNWYLSLPSLLHFDIPTELDVPSMTDDLALILRHRYLGLREYVGRPFVKLCVDYSLHDIEPSLRSRVTSLASQSVHCCITKILQLKPFRHQGTWFSMRQMLTSTLVLCAVCLAQHRSDRVAAGAILFPPGWLPKIRESLTQLESSFWNEENGGGKALYSVIRSALSVCANFNAQDSATSVSGAASEKSISANHVNVSG
ncbi:hypothetical protein S40288_09755 [Stachybotrys chartarum IBT 40288]|nr:hypothetical protein S40288_09755 [Stachybotrys chartarum IBT 40288]